MNVYRTSIHLATHQFPRLLHILYILSSTVSPAALNNSARTSSGPVALRLAVSSVPSIEKLIDDVCDDHDGICKYVPDIM